MAGSAGSGRRESRGAERAWFPKKPGALRSPRPCGATVPAEPGPAPPPEGGEASHQQQPVRDRGLSWRGRHFRGSAGAALTREQSPACSNHAVLEAMRSRQAARHQTGLPRFRRSRPAKPCVQLSSEGPCHPRATRRKPGQQQRRYDEEPDHPSRQRHPTMPVGATGPFDRSRTTASCFRAGQVTRQLGERLKPAHRTVGPARAATPKSGSRTGPGHGARQKNSWSTTALPFLKGPRCATWSKTPRREERASAAAGHRQSQRPSTRRRLFPREDAPSRRSSPGSPSAEVGPRAIRKPHIHRGDTRRPGAPRPEVMRTPEAGCRRWWACGWTVGLVRVGCAAEAAEPAQPDGTHNQEASGIFSQVDWSLRSKQGSGAGVALPCRSRVEPTCPRAGPEPKIPKLKGFLIRRPDGFSRSLRLGAQGVRPGTARETYRLSCQRSLSHLTLMGFRPLQRIGQRKRPAPDSPSGCATLSGFLNLSAF